MVVRELNSLAMHVAFCSRRVRWPGGLLEKRSSPATVERIWERRSADDLTPLATRRRLGAWEYVWISSAQQSTSLLACS